MTGTRTVLLAGNEGLLVSNKVSGENFQLAVLGSGKRSNLPSRESLRHH